MGVVYVPSGKDGAYIRMYSGCDYSYKSCLCTLPSLLHPLIQFYSIAFILVSVLESVKLAPKRW